MTHNKTDLRPFIRAIILNKLISFNVYGQGIVKGVLTKILGGEGPLSDIIFKMQLKSQHGLKIDYVKYDLITYDTLTVYPETEKILWKLEHEDNKLR